jgi:hypothetical protein
MDLAYKYLEATIHDLVYFLGIELFRHGGEICHVCEEHGHQLALPLDGAARVEDFVSEGFWGVCSRFGVVDRRCCFFAESMAAFTAELEIRRI